MVRVLLISGFVLLISVVYGVCFAVVAAGVGVGGVGGDGSGVVDTVGCCYVAVGVDGGIACCGCFMIS